jgi:predicted ribonuclease YlaK
MAFFGITARNEAQKRAFEALINDKPFTFITGPAGGGKTLIAEAVGLQHTVEEQRYRKFVYTRLQEQLGKDVGAIPGDFSEKTYPFMRPFLDNLDVMSDDAKQLVGYLTAGNKAKIYFDPIQTMRGGTQHYTFQLADEVQNLDVATMHAVATRLGEGSKFVFVGNFAQIDVPKLRRPENNGLYRLLHGLYDREEYDLFDHINFTAVERHRAVAVVEDIMRNNEMAPEFEALEARGNVE